MIPQRIQLKGFLCYKDEQEVTFDSNATLWMLSGLNGSGKSSIFDAVTYALFGHHRGGSQHAIELINKDSDGLAIEFDFRLDDQTHRIRRTLRRTARGAQTATQQIYRYEAASAVNGAAKGGGKWIAVEGTNYKREFDNWIGDKIGLNYETFTSSVLLLQGKADKLLDSKPEGRRAVLASIVDLERYERLHDLADKKRKDLKDDMERLSKRLEGTPEVKTEQVAEAKENIRTAEETREQAGKEVDRLRETELQARGWMDLQGKLMAARQRWQRAGKLLEDSAAIERDVERLRELRDVLPRLSEIANCRTRMHTAQTEMERLGKERNKAADLLAQLGLALDQAREKRESLQKLLESEESRHQTASGRLLEAKIHLERLEQYERQENELAQVRAELKRLPADPDGEVIQAREACERLVEASQVVPLLERFGRQRDDLRKAVEQESAALALLEEIKERGGKHKAEIERLTPLAEEAKAALQRASDDVAEARTMVKQARDSLTEATHLEGATVCRHCGQQLTPGHIDDEKRKRGEQLRLAQTREQQAKECHRQAQENEHKLRTELTREEKNRTEARVEFEKTRGQHTRAEQEIRRLQTECTRCHSELPEAVRTKISAGPPEDWLTTTYPEAGDLAALRAEVERLPAARLRLRQAEEARNGWTTLKAKETAHLDQLQRSARELPSDRASVRANHSRLALEVQTHKKTIEAHKANVKTTEGDIKRLTREREQADTALRNCDSQVKSQELAREHANNAMQKQLKALPAAWQPEAAEIGLTQVHLWESEKADLEAKRTDDRNRDLQHARLNLDVLRLEVESLEAQQQDFAEDTRRDPAAVKIELERAKQTAALREKDLATAKQQLALLQEYVKQREQIGVDYTRLEGELRQQKTLADLLGKDRLQLHLVRQAEKQVVEYANAVLDRLSGGQLYLRLSGEANGEGNSGRALDLEAYNRGTGEKPINVAFLSGSQKFRVAVSLALGIGQYASRQHRPIESVIIDEGFGCLDSQGRQVMIQELQNLRSQMRCILLVSHQEEFAEAFSDGYHFELESGATKVKRFQK